MENCVEFSLVNTCEGTGTGLFQPPGCGITNQVKAIRQKLVNEVTENVPAWKFTMMIYQP